MTIYLGEISGSSTVPPGGPPALVVAKWPPESDPPLIPISFTKHTETEYPSWFRCQPWPATVAMFREFAADPYLNKKAAPLFSPTFFLEDTRSHRNSTQAAMVVLDGEHVASTADVVDALRSALGVEAVVYTSASNRESDPHWRLLLPIPLLIDRHRYNEIAKAIRRVLESILGEKSIDPTKLHCGDLFYVPGSYAGAINEFHHIDGDILSPEQWLALVDRLAPLPLPNDIIESPKTYDGDLDVDDVIAAVEATTNDIADRDKWIAYGAAIFSALGSGGKSLFVDFTNRRTGGHNSSPREVEQDINKVWSGFSTTGARATVGTIFWTVRQQNPDWERPSVAKRRQERTEFITACAGSYDAGRPLHKLKPGPEWFAAMGETLEDMDMNGRDARRDYSADDDPFSSGDYADRNENMDQDTRSQTRTSSDDDDDLWPIHKGVDLPMMIPPRQWVLDVYWCLGFVSSTASAGASGKTTLTLARAIQVATGREDLTGEHVFRVLPVLYVCFEDDREEIERRVHAICVKHNIKPAELNNFHYHIINTGDVLAEREDSKFGQGKMVEGRLVRRLRNAVKKHGYGVVILDPFVNVHALEENDNKAMNFVKTILVRLASELRIAVDIPHHVPKGQREAGDADSWRGGSALRDGLRLAYTLSTMTAKEAEGYGIEKAESFRYIHTDSAKVNITRGGVQRWFMLDSVAIGNKDDLYPNGDNVQAIGPWIPPLSPALVVLDQPEIGNAILSNIAAADPPYALNGSAKGKLTNIRTAFLDQFPNISADALKNIIERWIAKGMLYTDDIPNPNRNNKNETYKAVLHYSYKKANSEAGLFN